MKNFKTILTLIIGAVIGFSFCHLFHGRPIDDVFPANVSDAKAADLEKKMQRTEVSYQQKEDSLNQHNDSLKTQLKQNETVLGKMRKKNNDLQQQVYSLIDKQGIYKQEKDTSNYYTICDSLARMSSRLIVVSNEQDSLSQVSMQTFAGQLQNRDSVIMLKLSQYHEIKSTLSQSLDQQQLLEKAAKFYKKKLKRQRFFGKLKSIGLLIISGLAAKQLIH